MRDSEQAYRDLGMLAYLTTTGRPIDEADRQRLVNRLWALEQQGTLPAFRLVTLRRRPRRRPRRRCRSRRPRSRPRRRLRPRRRRPADRRASGAARARPRATARYRRRLPAPAAAHPRPAEPPAPPTRRRTPPAPAESRARSPGTLTTGGTGSTAVRRSGGARSTTASPRAGSADCITGWVVSRKCAVACRITEESQQPMLPQSRHCRSDTQV